MKKGFTVTEIHCDKKFHEAMDPYSAKQDPLINMNHASAQKHVLRAEHDNQMIQEQVQATYHRLPYEIHLKL